MNKKELGRLGEEEAVTFLERKGHRILFKNWRHKNAEVDIISKDEEILVFTEVKTRSSMRDHEIDMRVSLHQTRRILDAANAFLWSNDYEGEVRFDLISVEFKRGHFSVKHFTDVYWPMS